MSGSGYNKLLFSGEGSTGPKFAETFIKRLNVKFWGKESDSKKLNDAYKVDTMGECLIGAIYDEQFQLYNEDNLPSWKEFSAKFVERFSRESPLEKAVGVIEAFSVCQGNNPMENYIETWDENYE